MLLRVIQLIESVSSFDATLNTVRQAIDFFAYESAAEVHQAKSRNSGALFRLAAARQGDGEDVRCYDSGMVLGYHLVLSAYGFWLPNDPRGSCSTFVGSEDIFRFGRAKTASSRASQSDAKHDDRQRMAAKRALRRDPVVLTGVQARSVGAGFALAVNELRITCWARAILPDHVHLVIGRSSLLIEQVSARLKMRASAKLVSDGVHPFAKKRDEHGNLSSVWAEGEWKVYLNTSESIRSAMAYVQENPVKAGLPVQRWSFVSEYDGH